MVDHPLPDDSHLDHHGHYQDMIIMPIMVNISHQPIGLENIGLDLHVIKHQISWKYHSVKKRRIMAFFGPRLYIHFVLIITNNHSRKFDRNIFALCVVKSYHTLNEDLFVRGDIANCFYLRFFDLTKIWKCVKIFIFLTLTAWGSLEHRLITTSSSSS